MTGNRYRRDVTQYASGRYGFTITDMRDGHIVYSGTGYSDHAAADADCRFYIVQLAGQVALLPSMTNDQPTIATQKGLF